MASLDQLNKQESDLVERLSITQASLAGARRTLQNLTRDLPFARSDTQRNRLQQGIKQTENTIKNLTQEESQLKNDLQLTRLEIRQEQQRLTDQRSAAATGSGAVSSAGVAQDDQAAKTDTSNTQNPEVTSLVVDPGGRVSVRPLTQAPSNAQSFQDTQPAQDTGTDAPVRTLQATQSTNGPENTAALRSPDDPPAPSQRPGAGADNDDQPRNTTQARVEEIFGTETFGPLPNVLDQYASYTYTVSVYLMGENAVKTFFTTKRKSLPGYQLLFQSGGAPNSSGVSMRSDVAVDDVETAYRDSVGRNPYFSLDYYIENLKLTSKIKGRGTHTAHNVTEFEMSVVEPNGISLLDNLYRANQEFNGKTGTNMNYKAANYCLVIRFYGYDDQGNLVRAGIPNADGTTDPDAVVEKWYPFRIKNITFSLQSRLVEYRWECIAIPHEVNAGQARGTIFYNVELSAGTLGELLGGEAKYSGSSSNTSSATASQPTTDPAANPSLRARLQAQTNSATPAELGQPDPEESSTPQTNNTPAAPPKADAAPKARTVTSGLMAALNEYQAELVRLGIYDYPDEYSIEFADPILRDAKVTKPGSTDKSSTPMSAPNATAADQKLSSKQSMNKDARNFSATAGMPIVQFIDQVTRNSSYVTDQQIIVIDEVTGQPKPNGASGRTLAWYKITMQAVPTQYDAKRNDYAYKIRFFLAPYQISDLDSAYFPNVQLPGIHKTYSYWFTGENDSVLDFKQDFNALYYTVISGGPSDANKTRTSSAREMQKRYYQPRSNQSDQGAQNAVNEPAANAADYLYSFADQAQAKITIVGDPAWLQQGEVTEGFDANNFNFSAFLPDGTINYDARQIVFEIDFNLIKDYNLNTGLMDVGEKNYGSDRAAGAAGRARQSYIYKAHTVTSTFDNGRFTQEVEGNLLPLYLDPPPSASSAAATATVNRTPVKAANQETAPDVGPTLMELEYGVTPENAAGAVPYESQLGKLPGQTTTYYSELTGDGNAADPEAQFMSPLTLSEPQPASANSNGAAVGTSQFGSPPTAGTTNNSSGSLQTQPNPAQPVATQAFGSNGQTYTVTSQAEISALQNRGAITRQEALTASNALALKSRTAGQQTVNNQTGNQNLATET